MTAPAIPDDVLARCHFYRTVCELPCHADESGRLTVTIGAGLRGLTTPDLLGHSMKALLEEQALLGPIIWHRSNRYTFLARYSAEVEDDYRFSSALLRTNSMIIPAGGLVALPGPGDDRRVLRRWIHPARDRFRPTMHTLLSALLQCADKEGDDRSGARTMRKVEYRAGGERNEPRAGAN